MSDKKPTHIERESHELDGRIEKLKSGRGIFNFEGVLVEQIVGGWKCLGGIHTEPEQVLEAIKLAGGSLERSIVYPVTVNGGFECQNTEKL